MCRSKYVCRYLNIVFTSYVPMLSTHTSFFRSCAFPVLDSHLSNNHEMVFLFFLTKAACHTFDPEVVLGSVLRRRLGPSPPDACFAVAAEQGAWAI